MPTSPDEKEGILRENTKAFIKGLLGGDKVYGELSKLAKRVKEYDFNEKVGAKIIESVEERRGEFEAQAEAVYQQIVKSEQYNKSETVDNFLRAVRTSQADDNPDNNWDWRATADLVVGKGALRLIGSGSIEAITEDGGFNIDFITTDGKTSDLAKREMDKKNPEIRKRAAARIMAVFQVAGSDTDIASVSEGEVRYFEAILKGDKKTAAEKGFGISEAEKLGRGVMKIALANEAIEDVATQALRTVICGENPDENQIKRFDQARDKGNFRRVLHDFNLPDRLDHGFKPGQVTLSRYDQVLGRFITGHFYGQIKK